MEKQKNYEVATLKDVSMEIDKIIDDCADMDIQATASFSSALAIAQSVEILRQIFLTNPEIKNTIEAMQDTKLGFLTDRSPKVVAAAKAQGKNIVPYTYPEIVEVVIEGLLKGYRITNNEFNMIASSFYAAKNGKYRKIVEYPGITDFQYATTPPAMDGEHYAKVKAFASWKKDGVKVTLGFSDQERGQEDSQVFKIRVNRYMQEDAIIGKAQSKLFARVLERITGRVLPESTDVEDAIIDVEYKDGKTLTTNGKPQAKTAGPDPYAATKMPENMWTCDVCKSTFVVKNDLIEHHRAEHAKPAPPSNKDEKNTLFERLKMARTTFVEMVLDNPDEICQMMPDEVAYLKNKWAGKTDDPWPLLNATEEPESPEDQQSKEGEGDHMPDLSNGSGSDFHGWLDDVKEIIGPAKFAQGLREVGIDNITKITPIQQDKTRQWFNRAVDEME
uniref:C2H2-type domain-containing protein n=1 Tax=viral metagenome TaxID=1070528 RepID=A0A6M3IYV4_9ZZZZ